MNCSLSRMILTVQEVKTIWVQTFSKLTLTFNSKTKIKIFFQLLTEQSTKWKFQWHYETIMSVVWLNLYFYAILLLILLFTKLRQKYWLQKKVFTAYWEAVSRWSFICHGLCFVVFRDVLKRFFVLGVKSLDKQQLQSALLEASKKVNRKIYQ